MYRIRDIASCTFSLFLENQGGSLSKTDSLETVVSSFWALFKIRASNFAISLLLVVTNDLMVAKLLETFFSSISKA
jgi:hypothetical protein